MADVDVVAALISRRTELVDLIQHQQKKIKRLTEVLAHLEATVKLFSADFELRTGATLALTRIDPFLLTRADPLPGVARWHVKERKGSRHRGTSLDG